MRIATVSCFAPWWQAYPVDVLDRLEGMTVGGGEEAFLRTAVGLAALDHNVDAWHYGQPGTWNGVRFRGPQEALYSRLVAEPYDAVIAWSGLRPLEYVRPGAKRILAQQLNDLWLIGDWNAVDCIVSPSYNHAAMLRAQGWKGSQAVVYNGVPTELLQFYAQAPAWHERPEWVGYWSSPDRGLHHLLHAWPLIHKARPKAQLHVFYEIKRFLDLARAVSISYFGERARMIGEAVAALSSDPSVVFHGAVPRLKLAQTQVQCRVQCYPYDPFCYTEGFAIAVCQGLAAGCLVMTTPQDAMPELYGDVPFWLAEDPLSKSFVANLADQVIAGLVGELPEQTEKLMQGPAVVRQYTWQAASAQMARVCVGENWILQAPMPGRAPVPRRALVPA